MNKLVLLLSLCALVITQAYAEEEDKLKLPGTEVVVHTHDGNDLSLYQYPASGKDLVIWVGANGWHDRMTRMAMDIAARGMEVWQIDFAEALMQTSSSNFLRNLDARYVADIVDAAHQRTGKRVILFAQGYVAIPVLRGATIWQQRSRHFGKLVGTVLFSPDLVTGLPELGKDPEYLEIVHQTRIPMMIYQGGLHGSPAHFARLVKALSASNDYVYHQTLAGVTSIFYHDENNPETLRMLRELPDNVAKLFNFFDSLTVQASGTAYNQPSQVSEARPDIRLNAYAGNPQPLAIDLQDAHGTRFNLSDYRGKITVVNFWATWCPPCVEEIPSLNRLRDKMKDQPFELISVNYADTPQKIRDFMKRVNVEFPVLVDPNGKTAQQWNVIGFPSTFVIGKDGKIAFGVNAAIHWDSQEVIDTLNTLNR